MRDSYFGIDISHWNDITNFDSVSEQIEFVILKAGGSDKGFYKDSCFDRYFNEFSMRGVPIGAYYFVGKKFHSDEDGICDAERFLRIVENKKFEYPLILDLEATASEEKSGVTDASVAFLDTLENNGFYAMIYASDISGFKDRLQIQKLDHYDKWVAIYGSKPRYVKSYGIHQYSSAGHMNGISGRVDLDISYKDYPAIMKKYHLNNY